MKFFLSVLLMVCSCVLLAQEKEEFYTYYSNGKVRVKYTQVDSLLYVGVYYKSGVLKDTSTTLNDFYQGIRKTYYRDGSQKFEYDYGAVPELGTAKIKRYFKGGKLQAIGGFRKKKRFGIQQTFNKKGEMISYLDMNKERWINVGRKYKKHRHLEGTEWMSKMEDNYLLLQKGDNEVMIKPGSLFGIKKKNDSTTLRHMLVESFSESKIHVSQFSYDLSDNKKTLRYDSTYSIDYVAIESIFFAANHRGRRQEWAFVTTIIGTELVVIPIVFAPIFGFSLLIEPIVIGYFIAGPPLVIWGNHMTKNLVPKTYEFGEWSYSIQKN